MHFEEAIEHLLKAEGGLLIADSEHGGGANMGVSLTVLQEYRDNPNLTLMDLQGITKEEVRELYQVMFWNKIDGDKIKGRLTAIAMLDQVVNRGVKGFRESLLHMLAKRFKLVLNDQTYPAIVAVLNEYEDKQTFIEILASAQHHYIRLAIDKPEKFLSWQPGWLNRTHNLLRLSLD